MTLTLLVAVTTERGARWRHGCRTYGLDEGRRGNQSDDRENSDKLLHDALRGGCASNNTRMQEHSDEANISVN